MNHVWRLGVFLGIAAVFLSGCMVPRVVVDPTYGKAKYEDLVRKGDPFKWKVAVEMQWNGVHQPRHDMTLRHHVERVLRNSGLILPTPDSTAGEIKVVLNDTADVEAARAKGLATAFSFGIVGNTVTDYLEMDIAISAKGTLRLNMAYSSQMISRAPRTTCTSAKLTACCSVSVSLVMRLMMSPASWRV